MWLTLMISYLRPPLMTKWQSICETPTTLQMAILVISMTLISIGAGDIRSCSLAFVGQKIWLKKQKGFGELLWMVLCLYNNCCPHIYDNSCLYSRTSLLESGKWCSCNSYVLVHFLILCCFFTLLQAKRMHNLLTGFAQVLVATCKNRKVSFSPRDSDRKYYYEKNSESIVPIENLGYYYIIKVVTKETNTLILIKKNYCHASSETQNNV